MTGDAAPSRTHQALTLTGSVLVPVAAGGAVGLLTQDAIPGWYEQLEKPAWTPPQWLFGPVWTALYATMGFAAWLVWRRGRTAEDSAVRRGSQVALGLYTLQLVVNLAWSPVFFTMQRLGLALAVILVLWGLIAAMIERFARIHPLAAALLVPYLVWVTFATALNAAIWWLNR